MNVADKRSAVRRILTLALALALWLAGPAAAATLSAWTEATGDAQSLRAIVTGDCPVALVDGAAVPLALRAAPDPTAFPVRTCQADLPKGARGATLDGVAVPVRPAAIDRIVVLGDTGCRLKYTPSDPPERRLLQACNDPVRWPFATVARVAAAEKPDLVIHVGDYYYRESPCPTADAGCRDSPTGDRWPAWQADFFGPAAPLLAAAPWVFVRGNHEQCGRGAEGWFRFLDAGPRPLACPAAARPFAVPIGPESLDVLDSADTEDASAPRDKVALFRDQLDALQPGLASGRGWIVTHRPIWGFSPPRTGVIGDHDDMPVNRTEQAAVAGEALDGIQLIVSGHVHLFAASGFGAARPAQLIVGTGGDLRDGDRPDAQAETVTIAGLPAATFVVEQFGYLVLERAGTGWTGTLKDTGGGVLARCTLAGRDLACRPPG